MWWLNKDHRCRDGERKRGEANDIPGALQHMAHQSRVKPPHKLHALYIAICINKLLLFYSLALMHEQEGSVPLTNKLFYLFMFIWAPWCDLSSHSRIFSHGHSNPLTNTLVFEKCTFVWSEVISYVLKSNYGVGAAGQNAREKLSLRWWNFNMLICLVSFHGDSPGCPIAGLRGELPGAVLCICSCCSFTS